MKNLLPVVALVLCAFAPPAVAETAEEAVAYAFIGLADGATLERSGTTMSWVKTNDSPATFDGEAVIDGHRSDIRFIVTAIEDCRYEITLEGPASLVPGGSRLFARVELPDIADVTIEEGGYKASVDGIGFCETGQVNPNCMTIHSLDLFGSVDLDRHRKAVDFLRSKVCAVVN